MHVFICLTTLLGLALVLAIANVCGLGVGVVSALICRKRLAVGVGAPLGGLLLACKRVYCLAAIVK